MVTRFLLHHRHAPRECPVAFAAWRGFRSPLRRRATIGSCAWGGHELWWDVEAESEAAALACLPPFVAERTRTVRIAEIDIP